MCRRFTITMTWRDMVELYGIHDQPALNLRLRYNVAPSQDVPIIRSAQYDGREATLARWGLVPARVKNAKVGHRCVNAMAESIDRRPAFRSAFESRRCLVPADGYYEWKRREEGGEQPYRLCLANRQPFAFAGLWERNDTLELTSCTIITTPPNEVAAAIHDRMPAILPPADCETWLSTHAAPADAKALLRPYEGAMIAYPVSKAIGTADYDRAELIEEVHVTG